MNSITRARKFQWDQLPKDQPMALLERWRLIGEKAMISRVLLHKGCFVPSHSHPNEQFACILSGRLRFILNDGSSVPREELIVAAGEVLHLPSNVAHSAEALGDTFVLDIFSPPSEKTGIDRKA